MRIKAGSFLASLRPSPSLSDGFYLRRITDVPDYPDLYLMRHGETVWNAEGRIQGRLDSPLTSSGRQQAHGLARLVAPVEDALRVASPQGRAVETARIVFGSQAFETDTRLAEIDTGNFSGRLLVELRDQHPEVFREGSLDWYDRTPDGERLACLRTRVTSFLGGLTRPTLIVTHGITLRMIRLVAMGLPPDRLGDMPVVQGAVHVVCRQGHQIWQT